MPVQTLPRSAEAYTRAQRAEIAAAVAAVGRAWRRVGDDFESSFVSVLPSLLAITSTAQLRVAEGAAGYVPAVLEETGQRVPAVGQVVPESFVGVDGSGRPVDGLLYGAVVHAKQQMLSRPLVDDDGEPIGWHPAATPKQALASAGTWLSTVVGTMLSDTGRAAERVGMAAHRVGGYVRMLVPPSCSRCAVLAGAWYADSVAFQRHPRCDCRHIPASEGVGSSMTVDSGAYFESLSAEEQDRIFTKAGAEAIREGADINQVVNARRGMKRAQVGGRDVLVTTEGTTRRGLAYQQLSPSRASDVRSGGRYARANRPRLMPETIREIATDRDDYLRLLKANGYLR